MPCFRAGCLLYAKLSLAAVGSSATSQMQWGSWCFSKAGAGLCYSVPPVTCSRSISVSTVFDLASHQPVPPHSSGAQRAAPMHRAPQSGVRVCGACPGHVIWLCTSLHMQRSDGPLWCFSEGVHLCKACGGFQRGQLSCAYSVWLVLLLDVAQQVWRSLRVQRNLWFNKDSLYIENPDA